MDYKIYATVENDVITYFEARIDSQPKEGEKEFPKNWNGEVGDKLTDFDKKGISKIR